MTHIFTVYHHCISSMACHLFSTSPLFESMLTYSWYCILDPWKTKFDEILIRRRLFSYEEMHIKMSLSNISPVCLNWNVLPIMMTLTLHQIICSLVVNLPSDKMLKWVWVFESGFGFSYVHYLTTWLMQFTPVQGMCTHRVEIGIEIGTLIYHFHYLVSVIWFDDTLDLNSIYNHPTLYIIGLSDYIFFRNCQK